MDTLTKKRRSALMAKVRARGNKSTELRFVTLLRRHRLSGWRRNQFLFGQPDFVFKKVKVAIFVDGCFWRGCPKHGTKPKGNRTFWQNKFARNKARDVLVTRTLRRAGWSVLRIWEHELAKRNEARLVLRIQRVLD